MHDRWIHELIMKMTRGAESRNRDPKSRGSGGEEVSTSESLITMNRPIHCLWWLYGEYTGLRVHYPMIVWRVHRTEGAWLCNPGRDPYGNLQQGAPSLLTSQGRGRISLDAWVDAWWTPIHQFMGTLLALRCPHLNKFDRIDTPWWWHLSLR